ncbi:MAG: hypothetical protein NTU49_07185 [Gammaproteobacteria bacterium]|nr:hypothetical protein [Gammaproteobacteria bacterium]
MKKLLLGASIIALTCLATATFADENNTGAPVVSASTQDGSASTSTDSNATQTEQSQNPNQMTTQAEPQTNDANQPMTGSQQPTQENR